MTIPPGVTKQPTAAVFLVRAWRDDGQFRARITSSADITAEPPTQTEILIANPDDVGRHLATWLSEI
ncbi:MAG: hypothetical protein ACRDRX_06040 [Pseudonocardiaceae bacterium]